MKTIMLILASTFFLSFQMMAQKNETPVKSDKEKKNKTTNSNATKGGVKKAPDCTLITARQLPKNTGTVIRFGPKKAPSPI
jgi:hypothetical protein